MSLTKSLPVIIDFETAGLYGDFLCLGVAEGEGEPYVITDVKKALEFFSSLPTGTKVWAYNVEYEYSYAYSIGVDVKRFDWNCARILAHTINHNFKGTQSSLGFVASKLCPGTPKKEYKGPWELNDELIEYCKQDIAATRAVIKALDKYVGKFTRYGVNRGKIRKAMRNKAISTYKQRLEFALKTLVPARNKGLCIDTKLLEQMEAQVSKAIEELPVHILPVIKKGEPEVKTYKKGSYKKDGYLYFENCPIKYSNLSSFTCKSVAWWVKQRKPEFVNEAGNVVMKEPPADDPQLLPVYKAYRLSKYLGYFKNWRELGKQHNGYMTLHSHLDICGTLTGRLASANPNIQNIGGSRLSSLEDIAAFQKDIRKLVVARPGYTIIGADIDRAELMILAKILQNFGDNGLATKINANEDIHAYNAEQWGLQRVQAKALVFSIMYGATKYKVAEIVGCTPEEGEKVLERIKKGTPALKKAMDYYTDMAMQLGGVYDLFGDFKTYPTIRSKDQKVASAARRQLFNSVIQGTNASLMAWLCPQISDYLSTVGGFIVAIIHDEVLLEVPSEVADEVVEYLNTTWNDNYNIPNLEGLRFGMQFNKGSNWKETK